MLALENRRSTVIDLTGQEVPPLSEAEARAWERFDLIYRSLCAILYNYVPLSGHPGGSISSGRFVEALLFGTMDYDLAAPDREDADIVSYAAGHKALGLYGLWALRNEVAAQGAPELLPKSLAAQLRLEDLLGFRRNPVTHTPLYEKFSARALDGHPTPATPFVKLATGASGVGLCASVGLAFGAMDVYGLDGPRVHVVEGEGGLTPGRVAEALAAAGTAGLGNLRLHVDWNQASIDSNAVCRDGATPGDYVSWNPLELCHLHDWNVIYVPDGTDLAMVLAAQQRAEALPGHQPTAIVYRTTKGWRYGIQGKASHGAGHKLCSEGFHAAVAPLTEAVGSPLPSCDLSKPPCKTDGSGERLEACFWDALEAIRGAVAKNPEMVLLLAASLRASRRRLDAKNRTPRPNAPKVESVYELARAPGRPPAELELAPGTSTTLRGELGRVLHHYNVGSGGAFLGAAADLLDSTSLSLMARGFPGGYYHAAKNPGSRLLSIGGICEDAMSGVLTGLSAYGHHIGVASSYGAFMAPLGHVAARLHAIGNQAQPNRPYRPFILVCAHAGLKTGEDGPTHADPQALQILQDNFPRGTMITLTPWDPAELWPTVTAALARRPCLIAPFVTRPPEPVLDRAALRIPPAGAAAQGLYPFRRANGRGDGTVVLQGSAVAYAFLLGALPLLDAKGVDLNVFYVASSELFDLLPASEQESIYPEELARDAIGITDFTLPTLLRWVTSRRGREASLHPFRGGHYLGSGEGARVLEEAGLDGASQFAAIMRYVRER